MGYMRTMIELADRLKTSRTEAMRQHGAGYGQAVEPFKDAIIRHMAATGLTPLDATMKLAKTSVDYGKDPLMLLAAGVELAMVGGAV